MPLRPGVLGWNPSTTLPCRGHCQWLLPASVRARARGCAVEDAAVPEIALGSCAGACRATATVVRASPNSIPSVPTLRQYPCRKVIMNAPASVQRSAIAGPALRLFFRIITGPSSGNAFQQRYEADRTQRFFRITEGFTVHLQQFLRLRLADRNDQATAYGQLLQ